MTLGPGPVGTDPMLGVAIVSNVRVVRDVLARILGSEDSLMVVGSYSFETMFTANLDAADVVLIDASSVGPDSLSKMLELSHRPVAAFAVASDDDEMIVRCATIGIRAFADGDATASEIAHAVRGAASQEVVCPPSLVPAFIRATSRASSTAESPSASALTPREKDVIALVERGLSNKEIATVLGISLSTAKNHIHNILLKLSTPGRREAAALAKGSITGPRIRSSDRRL